MKLRYLFTSAIAFMTLLSGCMKDEIASLDGLSAEPSYVSLGLEAGTKKCVVKANAAWTLEKADDASWLTIDPMSGEAGTVEVTFTMEATETPRKTEVMLVSGGKTQIITVGQNGEVEMKITSCKDFADDNVCPTGASYYVEGFITKVEKYDYGNLYIKDDAGDQIYVYGVLDADGNSKNFTSLGIDVGDKVILYGLKKYYGTTLEMENATLIEVTVPAVFDLNFRAIRDMYKEKNPDKEEEYSKYTKDDWKNLLKADLQDLTLTGGEIQIPYTFKGESFEIDPSVDWIRLKGIAQNESGYVATFEVDPYDVKAAPRKTTLVLKGKTTVNNVEKESNLELPVVQYGNTPDPVAVSEAIAQPEGTWLSVKGIVTGLHKKGCHVTDEAGNTIYAYVNGADEKTVGAVVGDEVLLTGELGSYKQFYQIKTPVIRVLSSKNEKKLTPQVVDAELLSTIASQKQTAVYVEVEGVADAANYGAVTVADNTISPYYILDSFKYSDLYGKKVKLTGFAVQYDGTKKDLRIVVTSAMEARPLTIAEVRAKAAGDAVEATGTVMAIHQKGYIISDETGSIYVYTNAAPTVKIGNKVTLSGTFDNYYGTLQIKNATVSANDDATTVTYPTPVDLTDPATYEAYGKYDKTNPTDFAYVKITGVLQSDKRTIKVGDLAKTAQLDWSSSDYSELAGKTVVVTAYMKGFHSNGYYQLIETSVVEAK